MADKDTALADQLKDVDLFAGLPPKHLQSLSRRARVVQHNPGHDVAQEGTSGVGFHLILDGEAVVLVRGEERRRLHKGDYFGEVSLIDGQPRSATVRAETPLKTLAITAWEFRPLLEEQPEIARVLLLKLCERLRAAEALPPEA